MHIESRGLAPNMMVGRMCDRIYLRESNYRDVLIDLPLLCFVRSGGQWGSQSVCTMIRSSLSLIRPRFKYCLIRIRVQSIVLLLVVHEQRTMPIMHVHRLSDPA